MLDIACKASCWGYRCFVVSKISGVCNLVTRNEPGLDELGRRQDDLCVIATNEEFISPRTHYKRDDDKK